LNKNINIGFKNVYEDSRRAESYARLEFPGTYYLAYRDIPSLIEKYVSGKTALDFGCGTGRSTRYLKNLGFDTVGADISADMIKIARELDIYGEYVLLTESSLNVLENRCFDLITAVFTFDNIPGAEYRTGLLKQLAVLLNRTGTILLVNSTPEIYLNEWLSFSTKDFPGNKKAKGGDKVKIIMTDVEDNRPVEDIVWFDNDYCDLFSAAGLKLIETFKPLGKIIEPYALVNETTIAPWVIYVLGK
jgi:ubiquinone/menaquinone biosynthesis C-methylase UbiE